LQVNIFYKQAGVLGNKPTTISVSGAGSS